MLRASTAKRLTYEDASLAMMFIGGVMVLMFIGTLFEGDQTTRITGAVVACFGVVFGSLRRRLEYDRVSGELRVFMALSVSPRLSCISVSAGKRCLRADLDAIVVKRIPGHDGVPDFVIQLSPKPVRTLPGVFPLGDVTLTLAQDHTLALELAGRFAADLELPVRDLVALGAIF